MTGGILRMSFFHIAARRVGENWSGAAGAGTVRDGKTGALK
jgi:hypothetical protein